LLNVQDEDSLTYYLFDRQHDSKSGSNVEIEVESDLIIGADGAHSALRQAVLKRPMTNFSQKYIEHGYMELYIPPTAESEVLFFAT